MSGFFKKKNNDYQGIAPATQAVMNQMENKKQDEETASVETEAPVKTQPAVKKKQFELSDNDFTFLGSNQYSDAAWESIGRRHGIDPATREVLPNTNNRAFLAMPKKWEPLPVSKPEMVTTKNISADYRQTAAVGATPAEIRAEMSRRNLTVPTGSEVTTEEI